MLRLLSWSLSVVCLFCRLHYSSAPLFSLAMPETNRQYRHIPCPFSEEIPSRGNGIFLRKVSPTEEEMLSCTSAFFCLDQDRVELLASWWSEASFQPLFCLPRATAKFHVNIFRKGNGPLAQTVANMELRLPPLPFETAILCIGRYSRAQYHSLQLQETPFRTVEAVGGGVSKRIHRRH